MAHVERRRQRGVDGKLGPPRWRARYRDPNGNEKSKTFDKKVDAERFLTEIEHSILSSAYVDPARGKVTFKSFAEEWRKIQAHRPGTRKSIEQHLRLHIYPSIGDRPINSIKPSEIQALVHRLSLETVDDKGKKRRGLGPSTIGIVYGRLVGVFNAAVLDRVIAASPCIDIKLPTPAPRRAEVLLPEQVSGLAAVVPDRYRALILTAASTGMRPSEVFGLTVDRVDFLRRTIKVDQQLVRSPEGGVELGPPKTPASYRTIPIPQSLVDELAAHLAEWPAHESGILFTNVRGMPVQGHPFAEVWRTAKKNSKAPEWATPHHLRHYYASVLIQAGSSIKVVQQRLGHSSAKTTLDIYGHLFPDEEDRTRDAIDENLQRLAACTRPELDPDEEKPRSEASSA